jgi:hypothetical protein
VSKKPKNSKPAQPALKAVPAEPATAPAPSPAPAPAPAATPPANATPAPARGKKARGGWLADKQAALVRNVRKTRMLADLVAANHAAADILVEDAERISTEIRMCADEVERKMSAFLGRLPTGFVGAAKVGKAPKAPKAPAFPVGARVAMTGEKALKDWGRFFSAEDLAEMEVAGVVSAGKLQVKVKSGSFLAVSTKDVTLAAKAA